MLLTAVTLVDSLRSAGCVYAEDDARLLLEAAPSPDHLSRLLQRRLAGEPLEHVLGWADLCGLRIALDPGVFVPRRRTELRALQAIAVASRVTSSSTCAVVPGRYCSPRCHLPCAAG